MNLKKEIKLMFILSLFVFLFFFFLGPKMFEFSFIYFLMDKVNIAFMLFLPSFYIGITLAGCFLLNYLIILFAKQFLKKNNIEFKSHLFPIMSMVLGIPVGYAIAYNKIISFIAIDNEKTTVPLSTLVELSLENIFMSVIIINLIILFMFYLFKRPKKVEGVRNTMLQKIKFNGWTKMTTFFGAIVLVNSSAWLVTSINQKTGSILVILTLTASLLVLPIFFVISMLSKKSFLIKLKSKGIVYLTTVRIGLLLLYALALLFAVYGVVYWNSPDYYLIAVSYLVLLVVVLISLVYDWHEINH